MNGDAKLKKLAIPDKEKWPCYEVKVYSSTGKQIKWTFPLSLFLCFFVVCVIFDQRLFFTNFDPPALMSADISCYGH